MRGPASSRRSCGAPVESYFRDYTGANAAALARIIAALIASASLSATAAENEDDADALTAQGMFCSATAQALFRACGNEVDDAGRQSALATDLRPFCAECRGAGYDGPECEPAGAFGYWPGEDARPSAADRPDGIGPEEAARRATYDTQPCGCALDPAQDGQQVLVCPRHADEAVVRVEALS